MNTDRDPRKSRLKIRMERPYEQFDVQQQSVFLDRLSCVSGCPRDDITNVVFRKACVVFEGDIDRNAAHAVIEAFLKRTEPDPSGLSEPFRAFVHEFNISSITDAKEYHVTIVKSKRPSGRKIVLVHGWSGTPDSFGQLPGYLQERLEDPVLLYQYPTGWVTHSPSVEYISMNLDAWIRTNAGGSRLAIIAHSMGGYAVRKLILKQSLRDDPLDRLVGLVALLASPASGVILAKLAKMVPGLRSEQITELAPGSPFLFALNTEWAAWCRRYVPSRCHVRSMIGTKDAVVGSSSGFNNDPECIPILGATHQGIIKPETADDPVVQNLVRLLGEAGFPTKQDRWASKPE